MVSLEQIRALEARVEKAVVLIDKLRRENAELEQRLIEASRSGEQVKAAYAELERKTADSARMASDSETRIAELAEKLKAAESENGNYRERALAAEQRSSELEAKAEELHREQARIEEGLDHALQKLDAFEDLVMGISAGSAAAPGESALPGDEKVEVVEQSPSTPDPQETPFPVSGAEHELDIF